MINAVRGSLIVALGLSVVLPVEAQIFILDHGTSGPNGVITSTNGTLAEYSSTGAVINPGVVTGLDAPSNVATDGVNLFISESTGTVAEYTPTGGLVSASLIAGLKPTVTRIAISGSSLFVSSFSGAIGEYSTSGAAVNASLISAYYPNFIASMGSNVFVADGSGKVSMYDNTGALISKAFTTGSLLATSGSDLFVLHGDGTIGEYQTSNGVVNAVNEHLISGLSGSYYYGMAVSGTNLYVSNWLTGTVSEYSTVTGNVINANFITGLTAPYGLVVATVPEPASGEMLIVGVLGLMVVGWSKKATL